MVYFIKSGKLKVVKEIKTYKNTGLNSLMSPNSKRDTRKDHQTSIFPYLNHNSKNNRGLGD